MPYTLVKGLVWILLAVVLGIVIGWLLRSVVARRQVERARSGRVDTPEVERLRARVANLETVVDDRDRLRAELTTARSAPTPTARAGPTVESSSGSADVATSAVLEAVADSESESSRPDGHDAPIAGGELDDAVAVLGRHVLADDLTVVEGIGPKICELCHGIGIMTWSELAVTEVSLLRTMLNDAGQRFKAHDPSTWPRQAAMLAAGQWAEFKMYTDELQGGRAAD